MKNISEMMDELVDKTMKSIEKSVKEKEKSGKDYGRLALLSFESSKQNLKKSKVGLETYLNYLDKHDQRDLVKVDDFEEIDLPLSREHTLFLIEDIDRMLLRILAGKTTDVLNDQ